MTLLRTVEQIKAMYLERSDSLDASSYEVVDLCEEIERLRAIVDRLPKTADGVPVLPGQKVWAVFGGDLVEEVDIMLPGSGGTYVGCYSTREAAEAARKENES